MQAFINKLSHSSTLLKNRYVQPYVVQESNSNLQKSALNLLWNELAIFDSDNLTWKNIAGAVRQIDGQTLLFPYYDGNIVKETVTQTIALLKDSEQISADLWIRKIAIQNGTERNGLAAQAARRFESMGFSVAEISNAPSADVLYTVVLDVSGNLEQARRVADVIRCTRVYSVVQADDDDGQSFDGVQVILGRDFDGQYVRQISFEGE
jgi:hypothetical protein